MRTRIPLFLAAIVAATSCGTSAVYTSNSASRQYQDGIYYRPAASSTGNYTASVSEASQLAAKTKGSEIYLKKGDVDSLFIPDNMVASITFSKQDSTTVINVFETDKNDFFLGFEPYGPWYYASYNWGAWPYWHYSPWRFSWRWSWAGSWWWDPWYYAWDYYWWDPWYYWYGWYGYGWLTWWPTYFWYTPSPRIAPVMRTTPTRDGIYRGNSFPSHGSNGGDRVLASRGGHSTHGGTHSISRQGLSGHSHHSGGLSARSAGAMGSIVKTNSIQSVDRSSLQRPSGQLASASGGFSASSAAARGVRAIGSASNSASEGYRPSTGSASSSKVGSSSSASSFRSGSSSYGSSNTRTSSSSGAVRSSGSSMGHSGGYSGGGMSHGGGGGGMSRGGGGGGRR